jgi:DUF1365 family protein
MVLERKPLTGTNLARVLLRFPAMTLKIVAAIHWQALLIFLRRNPVYDHPTPDYSGPDHPAHDPPGKTSRP